MMTIEIDTHSSLIVARFVFHRSVLLTAEGEMTRRHIKLANPLDGTRRKPTIPEIKPWRPSHYYLNYQISQLYHDIKYTQTFWQMRTCRIGFGHAKA